MYLLLFYTACLAQVMELVELTPISSKRVGLPGEGLSVEQRKVRCFEWSWRAMPGTRVPSWGYSDGTSRYCLADCPHLAAEANHRGGAGGQSLHRLHGECPATSCLPLDCSNPPAPRLASCASSDWPPRRHCPLCAGRADLRSGCARCQHRDACCAQHCLLGPHCRVHHPPAECGDLPGE